MPRNKMPEKIENISIKWQSESPFFAEFLLRFSYKDDSKHTPTAGVGFASNKMLFFYNKDWIDKLTLPEMEGVCVHEIMHIVNKFHDRLGNRDMQIFNIAQDACINEMIETTTIADQRLVLPKEGVRMKEIQEMGYKGESISELVYDFLEKRATKITIISSGGSGKGDGDQCQTCGAGGGHNHDQKDGAGSGHGQKSEEGEDGEGESDGGEGNEEKEGKGGGKPDNSLKGKDRCPSCGRKILRTTDDHRQMKELKDVEKAVLEDIINNARTRSWGTISGGMQAHIAELIKVQNIPWQQQLARFMSKFVHEPGQIYENTWSKRNRRSLPLPGVRKLSKKIVVSVDTSGSVADEDIAIFFGQIEKIVKDFSKMTLIQWDTQVNSVETYKKGAYKKITIKGRGGTSPQDLYDRVHKELKGTSILVNFTDGYFDWNINYYGIPTLWAVINNDNITVPFGKLVVVKREGRQKRNPWS